MRKQTKSMALLDWDGTIRRGFTLLPWARFLLANGKFASSALGELESVFSSYGVGDISYEHLAECSASIYAKGLTSQRTLDISYLAEDFAVAEGEFWPYAPRLFHLLHESNLTIAVISGAPEVVLQAHARNIGIDFVVGLTARTERNGEILSGLLGRNPARAETKQRYVEKFRRNFSILVAIGDTTDDLPLLTAARVPVMLTDGEKGELPFLPAGTIEVSHDNVLPHLQAALHSLAVGV